MTKRFKRYLKEASIGAPDFNPAIGDYESNVNDANPHTHDYGMFTKKGNEEVGMRVEDAAVLLMDGDYESKEQALKIMLDALDNLAEYPEFEEASDTEVRERAVAMFEKMLELGESQMDNTNEAVGDAAAPIYDLIDELGSHQLVMDELIRFLDVDQIEEFVADFRRHHDMKEADVEENAFNQAAAAAARAGKDEFEFGGKTHKTTMKKDTAHKLSDEVDYLKKLAGL